jgi:hypothetical protein
MEKQGNLLLTNEELTQIKAGILPHRIFETWGLSLNELIDMISNGEYKVMSSPE